MLELHALDAACEVVQCPAGEDDGAEASLTDGLDDGKVVTELEGSEGAHLTQAPNIVGDVLEDVEVVGEQEGADKLLHAVAIEGVRRSKIRDDRFWERAHERERVEHFGVEERHQIIVTTKGRRPGDVPDAR